MVALIPSSLPVVSRTTKLSFRSSIASVKALLPSKRLRTMLCVPFRVATLIQAAMVSPWSKAKSAWSGA